MDVQFQMIPPFTPNDNQSNKRKHNPKITFICHHAHLLGRLSFSVSTHDFFHLAEVSIPAFCWLYISVCAVAQKYNEMSFSYNYYNY